MCHKAAQAIVALWACIAAAGALAADPPVLVGKIVAIADGDTLTLLNADKRQHRIRLDGIEAPEAKQAFGNRSRQSLAELAHQQEAVADCSKIDSYKRQVCVVRINGLDVVLEQIKRGMAWHSSAMRPSRRPRIAGAMLRQNEKREPLTGGYGVIQRLQRLGTGDRSSKDSSVDPGQQSRNTPRCWMGLSVLNRH